VTEMTDLGNSQFIQRNSRMVRADGNSHTHLADVYSSQFLEAGGGGRDTLFREPRAQSQRVYP
jgi:hypothetical protein